LADANPVVCSGHELYVSGGGQESWLRSQADFRRRLVAVLIVQCEDVRDDVFKSSCANESKLVALALGDFLILEPTGFGHQVATLHLAVLGLVQVLDCGVAYIQKYRKACSDSTSDIFHAHPGLVAA